MLGETDGLMDGETLADGDTLLEGDTDGLTLLLGDCDGLAELDGDCEGETLLLGDSDGLALGDTLELSVTMSPPSQLSSLASVPFPHPDTPGLPVVSEASEPDMTSEPSSLTDIFEPVIDI